MRLIGKGSFTKAYLQDNGKVLLKSIDPIKEVMALGWFPESVLFPKLSFIDNGMYELEYYEKVRSLKGSLNTDQYQLYKDLRALYNSYTAPRNKYDGYSKLYELFDNSQLIEEVKFDLLEALDACSNIGSCIGFEISPRNVAVKNGKLILLDCFFCVDTLMKTRS